LNPNLVQLYIIGSICIPFLIPFFKRFKKIIPFIQVIYSLSFLLVFFTQKELFPLHITFGGWGIERGIEIVFSVESLLFLLTTNVVFLAVFIISLSKNRGWNYYFLLTLLLTDISCLFVANDLFNIYVTLELLSLLSYLLISIELKKRQIWSSLKYMILGAVGFNLYLIGISVVYGEAGTLNLSLLASANYQNDFAVMMIMIPLLIKSEIFFFSMWVPSAQTEAESSISAILSAVVVNAGLFHVLRITAALESQSTEIFLLLTGLTSAFLGAFLSARQRDIKMILAFSTMSHVGFVLIGLANFGAAYACSHTLYKSLLFLSVGYYYDIYHLKDCQRKRAKVPLSLFIAFLIGFLSFSGMPFFIGSTFKYEIIAGVNPLISFVLIVTSVISVFSLCRILFLIKPDKSWFLSPYQDLGITVLASVSIILGIINTRKHFSVFSLVEAVLILTIALIFYGFFSKKSSFYYPYKLFKLSSSLAIYSVIIGIIISISVFGVSFF